MCVCSSSAERHVELLEQASAEVPFLQQRASTRLFFFFCTLLVLAFLHIAHCSLRVSIIGGYCGEQYWWLPIAFVTVLIVCGSSSALWWSRQALKAFIACDFVIRQKELSALRYAQMVTATTSGSADVLGVIFRRSIITSILTLVYGRQLHFKVTELLLVPVLMSYIDLCSSTVYPPWALALCILGRLVVFVGYKYLVDQVSVDQNRWIQTVGYKQVARIPGQHKEEQQQPHQTRLADSGRTYNYARLHFNIGCVGIALIVLQIVASYQFVAALGATDVYDQPWLSLAVATLTSGAAAATVSPGYKLTTTFTLWYSLLTSGLCIAATTARAHSLLLTWDEVAASVIPQSVSLAVAAVGLLLLPKSWRRRRSRWCGGHWVGAGFSIRGMMLVAFPCGVALQCAYSMITTGGDPTIVSDIHLAAHAAGYTDLVCATALSGWTVAVLSGASLARTGSQLLFSMTFFLVIALGHASQFLIMVTAAVHLLLLTFRMILANRGSGMLGGITNAVQFDDDVTAGLVSVADAAKFV